MINMTIDKLKFKHQCLPSKECEKDQEEKELSAFEKFKRTSQYREILIKQGKIPPPIIEEDANAKKTKDLQSNVQNET